MSESTFSIWVQVIVKISQKCCLVNRQYTVCFNLIGYAYLKVTI